MTITEGLAEIKTIDKRVQKKQETIIAYLWRPDTLKDPLEKQGGSVAMIRAERQAIHDLHERKVRIRSAINHANVANDLTISGLTRTIEWWIVWKREVSKAYAAQLMQVRTALQQAHQQHVRFTMPRVQAEGEKATEVVVNIDEAEFAKEVEQLEDTLGQLDGQLSMKNATIQIVVRD